jgi:hypothetical protein
MAYQKYPEFPGKGAAPGWYQHPGGGSRYYAGGNEWRYSSPDGKTELIPAIGGLFSRNQQPLSPQAQARSDAQRAYNNGDRSQATLHALYPQRYGPPGSGPGKPKNEGAKPEAPAAPTAEVETPTAPADAETPAPAPTNTNSQVSPTSRDVDSPSGNGAKGTQTGPRGATMDEVNALLARQGVGNLRNPFESNNLPGTNDYRPANTENQAGNQNIGPIRDGEQYARNLEAARNGENTAISPSMTSGDPSLRFTAPEKNGIGAAYAPPTLGSASDMARRSAFLNAPDSLSGLRAVEAQAGVFAAEGKYFTVNPNAGGEGQNALTEISREQGDILKDGGAPAQEFLQQKMADLQGDSQFSQTLPPEVTVDGVNGIGPVKDGEQYANALAESENSQTNGIGPFRDGDRYASNFPNRRK